LRHTLVLTAAVCALSAAFIAAQQAKPAPPSTLVEDVLKEVRNDLQNDRSDIVAKNLSLTGDQAAKFWPVFNAYQKEQSAIIDEQLKGVQQYIQTFESLDDAAAAELMKAHLDRDARMVALRQKWFPEFQKAFGGKLAARAMQVDRRISLVQQLQIATRIPLVQ